MADNKQITLATVQLHNKADDLWIIIENKVYDVTKFRDDHPGGEEALVDVAGRDGTKDFLEVGHSSEARKIMEKYYIGDLAVSDQPTKLPVRKIAIDVGVVLICLLAGFLITRALRKN